jgi:hypothetical protein
VREHGCDVHIFADSFSQFDKQKGSAVDVYGAEHLLRLIGTRLRLLGVNDRADTVLLLTQTPALRGDQGSQEDDTIDDVAMVTTCEFLVT